MDGDATRLFVYFPCRVHEGRSLCSIITRDKRGNDWGELQRESLSHKSGMCTSTKSGRASVAGIISIRFDSAGFQLERQLTQKNKIRFSTLLPVVKATKVLLACH